MNSADILLDGFLNFVKILCHKRLTFPGRLARIKSNLVRRDPRTKAKQRGAEPDDRYRDVQSDDGSDYVRLLCERCFLLREDCRHGRHFCGVHYYLRPD